MAVKCSQCNTAAFYDVGGERGPHHLCLQCYSILEEIHFKKALLSAAMLNQANAEMDALAPFGPMSEMIPVAEIARAASQSRTYNNINVSNSNVGVINTGNLAKINAAIEISKGTDFEEFGARLKDLMEAIVNDASISKEAKQQMTEVVEAISNEAITSKKPSKVVVDALFAKLKEMSGGVVVIGAAAEKLYAAWQHFAAML